jgi:hypothetical protein
VASGEAYDERVGRDEGEVVDSHGESLHDLREHHPDGLGARLQREVASSVDAGSASSSGQLSLERGGKPVLLQRQHALMHRASQEQTLFAAALALVAASSAPMHAE